nr:UDP-glycosyltransferase [Nicotiana tabacum]
MHCEWNSIAESVNNGILMIAWPLYAEQKMNAAMLKEELGIAERPEVLPTKKVVEREGDSENEGKAMREKVKKLKVSAENALSKGGSSYDAMCQLLQDI